VKAALLCLVLLAPAASAQRAVAHPGLAEFSRICLEPRTVEFAMAPGEAERLGFEREIREKFSNEDIARLKLEGDAQFSIRTPAIIPHGETTDPDAYAVWTAPEKRQTLVQRVDVGNGRFGEPGFAVPATFCSVLTMSDPAKAWASFRQAFPDALFVAETESWLFGRMKTWAVDLPWAEGYAAIVTIADYRSEMMRGVRTIPDVALFTIEVITQKDFERLGNVLESRPAPI
jgi:hypothetical protein